ncbi:MULTISPECIES: DUF982 domain-containing protein [unclassified Rhizobium]|uniref:DUF982 domain-containing protein n=1 Tax=unclassified Rhizobium TaxID=2613769 RepID=UPI001ADABC90|nr:MULTISPECIES: DUF982 domain-containing protein [unclassified Rhizobium]MBO9127843.1 DUF982 domain-containing protein [Rhizobium sp. 16-488-2b]MBO9175131.1 DUF982 domain-containing protein [Rhizobium sp. 16-488-2a]
MHHDLSPIPIKPLGVAIDGPGRYRIVNTVSGLATLLMNNWPIREKGEDWRAALAACLKAFEEKAGGAAAREVFILAARSAEFSMILEADPLADIPHPRAPAQSIAIH